MFPNSNTQLSGKSGSNVFTNMFTPCSYEVEFLECALKQNTIVCVNTEAGKRFLSTMLIKEMMIKDDNLERNDNVVDNKLAILLLNNENTVKSQGELLQNHLNLDVKFCLKENSSDLSENDWTKLFVSNHVLTMSPELLMIALDVDHSLADEISLIIFDDCHLVCDSKHPYTNIMKILEDRHLCPSILGLTTSLLNEDVTADKINSKILQMETLLHSTAQTATDLIALDRHSLIKPIENIILSADKHKDEKDTAINLFNDVKTVLEQALNWLSSCQINANVELIIIDWEVETLVNGNDKQSDSQMNSEEENSSSTNKNVSLPDSKNLESTEACNDVNADKAETQTEDVCSTPKALLREVLVVLDILGPWCAYKLVELIIKQLHKILLGVERRIKQFILDNNDEEPTSGALIWQKMLLQYVNTKLQLVYTMCHQCMSHQKTVDLSFVSPKVHRLLQVLKEYKPISTSATQQNNKYNDRSGSNDGSWWQDSDADDEDEEEDQESKPAKSGLDGCSLTPFTNNLCGIVFVEEKNVALMLHRLLRDIAKEEKNFKHVSSCHLGASFVDSEQSNFDSNFEEKNKQEEVLRRFRNHESNLLITAASLEDCAHIPKCNLVVRFDAPRSYRVYAQSKSKACAFSSAYVMLIRESDKSEFMEKLQEYKRIEQVLKGSCSEMNNDAQSDNDDVDYDDVLPTYGGGNTTVTIDNSIKIVNRYCSRLPSDPFTHLSPRCEVVEEVWGGYFDDEPVYHCILQLPINSLLREPIQGQSMPSIKLAQQAVAVEACARLHQCGELDDNLMPIGKETVKYAEELDPWKPEKSSVLGRPGSTKRRQTYAKDSPKLLSDCLPSPNKAVFVYEIEMRMKCPLPEVLNVRMRRTYYPEDVKRCFGVLTTRPLPQLPGTPVFTRSGEETARLCLRKSFIQLTAQQIKLVKSFHRYILSDTLRVDRVPLVFKPEAASNQLLIVVLNKRSKSDHLDIDWRFMMRTDLKRRTAEKLKKDPWYSHRMSEKNKFFKYDRKSYEDAVVIRNYGSCDQPNRYYVAEIKDHLNPASPFPSADYMSYKHYYDSKYNVNVKSTEQPLLDVDHTPSRLNLLTPRYASRKGKLTSRDKKAKPKNPVIFVPELCDIDPIPASLWRKAVCLPTVLYRITQLLIGEEFRRDIAVKTGIVFDNLTLGHKWNDIDFSSNYADPNASFSVQKSLMDVDVMSDLENGDASANSEAMHLSNGVGTPEDQIKVNSDLDRGVNEIEVNSNHLLKNSSNVSDAEQEPSDGYFSDDYRRCFLSDDELDDFVRKKRKPALCSKKESNPGGYFISKLHVDNYFSSLDVKESEVGPGPEVILQALTLSNASDGYNLERQEMLGDSFLKHAVTLYLYCTYPDAHEGKLSYMRSKKVSNYNLYRIGRGFGIAGKMTAHIFDPIVNWLPAGYAIGAPGQDDGDGFSDDEVEIGVWTGVPNQEKKQSSSSTSHNHTDLPSSSSEAPRNYEENEEEIYDEEEIRMIDGMLGGCLHRLGGSVQPVAVEKKGNNGMMGIDLAKVLSSHTSMHFTDKVALQRSAALSKSADDFVIDTWTPLDSSGKPLSNNDPLLFELHTQHSLSDKSIADSVEALIGAYLTSCGHRAAQLLLCHFGLTVLPKKDDVPSSMPTVARYGHLVAPLNHFSPTATSQPRVKQLLRNLKGFEKKISYNFSNKAYLLQAFTHASYHYNTATDCYQRLEFLGDAVLDFLITRYLCADDRQHTPGALTDLRCALVNNTIFASLAVRYDFHKYFKAISPDLQQVIEEFVSYQQQQEDAQGMDAQLMRHYTKSEAVSPDELDQTYMDGEEDEEEEEAEDVEVPKALGDIFESVAGAIFMDSGMSLDAVWDVYSVMMLPLMKKFSSCVPRSPVRELLEMEPETAKFSCAEKRFDGKIRVTVEIIGKGRFKGVGRSYRIAKSAAARRALRSLKRTYC